MRFAGYWLFGLVMISVPAMAEDAPPPAAASPGVIVEGSESVTIGGQSAARVGDKTNSGNVVVGGSSDVFINGKPAATQGDSTDCGGIIIGGSSNVFINGKPAAGTGSVATGCTEQ